MTIQILDFWAVDSMNTVSDLLIDVCAPSSWSTHKMLLSIVQSVLNSHIVGFYQIQISDQKYYTINDIHYIFCFLMTEAHKLLNKIILNFHHFSTIIINE